MLCYTNTHPHFRKVGTVPTEVPTWFSIIFWFVRKGPDNPKLWENIERNKR